MKKEKQSPPEKLTRRRFVAGTTVAAAGISIVPSHVLGGPRHIPPSDKINVAYIGTGTQGLRELPRLIQQPEVQVTAICDPQQKAIDYYDWSPTGLLNSMRELIGNPNWETGGNNTIPGGRDNGQQIVNGYYSRIKDENYKGCRAYPDFRELLAKEKDIDAMKIMSPDHLHGVMAMAAMKRGIHVTMHKPIANRLIEAKKVIDQANTSDVTTHLIAWDANGNMDQITAWIDGGVIGALKEVHNWSHRPVWPQYAEIPSETPSVPDGFDWDLWLGPEADRPYHPAYTNMVFRGWYDFGGGAMADMGHYSLWTVFKALKLEGPTIVEPNFVRVCTMRDNLRAHKIRNDYSYPFASKVRFRYPATDDRGPVDLFWYDGGMKPNVPDAYYEKDIEFPAEGMMFVGEKGIIMTSEFRVREPYVLQGDKGLAADIKTAEPRERERGEVRFVRGVRDGDQIEGSFREAWPITEAVNLYSVALRANMAIKYDADKMEITNDKTANNYLDRKYRSGWEIDKI